MSNIANIYTGTVRREETFTDTTKSLLSYARVFGESFGVRFVGVRILDVVEDMLSLHFLASSSRETCIRYIKGGKIMFKYQSVFPLPEKLDKDGLVARTIGITHLDGRRRYTSSEGKYS